MNFIKHNLSRMVTKNWKLISRQIEFIIFKNSNIAKCTSYVRIHCKSTGLIHYLNSVGVI
jgi:hypothetical protein